MGEDARGRVDTDAPGRSTDVGFARMVDKLDLELVPRVRALLKAASEGRGVGGRVDPGRLAAILEREGAAAGRLRQHLFDALPTEERGVLLLLWAELLDPDPPLWPGVERRGPAMRTIIVQGGEEEAEARVTEPEIRFLKRLSQRGLIRLSASGDWRRYMDLTCRLTPNLCQVLERRFPAQALSWADLTDTGLLARLGRVGGRLTRPIPERLEAASEDPRLPGPWPLPGFEGGVRPLGGLGNPRIQGLGKLGALRGLLEDHGLGTLGLAAGALPEVAMVLLPEVYTHHLEGLEPPTPSAPQSGRGLRLLRQLDRLVRAARERPLRFTTAEKLYRREAARLLGPEDQGPEELDQAARLALQVGLLEASGPKGDLRLGPAAADWPGWSVPVRQRWLLEQHTDGPADLLLEVLTGETRGDRWYRASHWWHLARREVQARVHEGSGLPMNAVQRRHERLSALLAGPLPEQGLVELSLDADGQVESWRVTPELRQLAADRIPPPRLFVNPDFEILLFPEPGAEQAAVDVSRIARLDKVEAVRHFRLEAQSVREAVLEGWSEERILSLLADHSEHPLPENVRLAIETWVGGVHRVEVSEVCLVRVDSHETLRQLKEHREFAQQLVEELTPTVAVLRHFPAGASLRARLRRDGIHLVTRTPKVADEEDE